MEPEKQGCRAANFNYCKWAKIAVAIPTLPIFGLLGASLFTHPVGQWFGALAAVSAAVALAMWIDRIPLLQKKIWVGKCANK